jgi:hypothetical protein
MSDDDVKRRAEADMLRYYWQDKGDLERYSNRAVAFALFPDVERAWRDYQYHERVLSALIRELP